MSSSVSSSTAATSVISSQGIGSGLDIASIVSSLTTAEAGPETNALNRSKTALTAQVSAFGTFNSALATFQATLSALSDPTQLSGRTATLGDTTIATATATSSAVPGQYSLSVQNLAAAASLSSQPVASSTSTVGTGTLTISVGGASSRISIDTTDNTLQGIVAAINSASDNPGVSASILTTTAGARLVLSGTKTGAANAITVAQSGGDGGLAALAYPATTSGTGANITTTGLTQTQAAVDASFTVNGYPATSASNQISTVITGVTFNLLKSTVTGTSPNTTDTPTTVTIGNDTTGAQTSIGTFVSALNGLLTSIQSLTSYDPTTQTAGPLLGNATLQSFQSQLSKLLGQVQSGITSGPNSLAALGIGANSAGTYSSNSTTLGNALTGSLDSVTKLLSGPTGIATQLNTFVNQYSQAGGLLDTISTSLQNSLKDNASQLTALNARMAVYSATLTTEYNAMDAAVALLKQTQTYLTQEFNSGSSSSSSSTSTSTGLGSGTVSTGG
ncbi:MAG TPA: flagellar filament capping protein FliD [Steroidobacteraceae bacterium]|nr:flagellar filament capping protein FliD [Steroidobacteraceae bacterium]